VLEFPAASRSIGSGTFKRNAGDGKMKGGAYTEMNLEIRPRQKMTEISVEKSLLFAFIL